MDAILDRIETALEAAGVDVDAATVAAPYDAKRIKPRSYTDKHGTEREFLSTTYDWTGYELQVGDGVTLGTNGNGQGVIEQIEGPFAHVHWFIGDSREVIALDKLEYMPTEENSLATRELIQSEWNAAKRHEANCYKSPECVPQSTAISGCMNGTNRVKRPYSFKSPPKLNDWTPKQSG